MPANDSYRQDRFMRIAILSDIHGNSIALDAVLDDIEAQGAVDGYWILGDMVNQGSDPVGVMERISCLPDARCVMGNTDRYLVKGGRRGPSFERVMAKPHLLTQLVSVEQGNGWARGAMSATGWFDWLRDLPFAQRVVLPNGTRVLGVHASLVSDELGFETNTTNEELSKRFPDCEADLVFAGHTHAEADLTANGTRFVTFGCIANAQTSDRRVKYGILEADESGYELTRRCVEIDCDRVVEAIKIAHHPCEEWLLKFYR